MPKLSHELKSDKFEQFTISSSASSQRQSNTFVIGTSHNYDVLKKTIKNRETHTVLNTHTHKKKQNPLDHSLGGGNTISL